MKNLLRPVSGSLHDRKKRIYSLRRNLSISLSVWRQQNGTLPTKNILDTSSFLSEKNITENIFKKTIYREGDATNSELKLW